MMQAWSDSLKNNPLFWELAFVFGVVLLIGAHKFNIEAMID
jgi:hypothetical protein